MTVLQDQPEGRVVREAKKGWTMCTRVPSWTRGQALRSRTHEKLRLLPGAGRTGADLDGEPWEGEEKGKTGQWV